MEASVRHLGRSQPHKLLRSSVLVLLMTFGQGMRANVRPTDDLPCGGNGNGRVVTRIVRDCDFAIGFACVVNNNVVSASGTDILDIRESYQGLVKRFRLRQ